MFDVIVARHDFEKIKTIGDYYVLCAGIPAKSVRIDNVRAIVFPIRTVHTSDASYAGFDNLFKKDIHLNRQRLEKY